MVREVARAVGCRSAVDAVHIASPLRATHASFAPEGRGIMPEPLIATAGIWFFAACAAAFASVFVEQAGAARSPEDEGERKGGAVALMLMLVSLLTPGLLLLHGFFLTAAVDTLLRIWIMAAPVSAILLGSIFGAILGAVARGTAPAMRKLALPFGLAALALTLFATSPSIVALVNGLQDGVLELPVRPV
jgi:hypothetical protein